MRYLKKFNESVSKEDLQDFCESSLAYLMDEGFTVSIMGGDDPRTRLPSGQFNIFLQKEAREFFKWDDVKNHYIPFIERIRNKYKLASSYINFTSSNGMDLKSEYISTLDNVNIYWDLSRITFKIEENSL
jgi:hypothetical protein